jgi:hypothetical protein
MDVKDSFLTIRENVGGQIAEDDIGPDLLFKVKLLNDAVSVVWIIRRKGM